MKKLLIGMLAFASLSTFASITTDGFSGKIVSVNVATSIDRVVVLTEGGSVVFSGKKDYQLGLSLIGSIGKTLDSHSYSTDATSNTINLLQVIIKE